MLKLMLNRFPLVMEVELFNLLWFKSQKLIKKFKKNTLH